MHSCSSGSASVGAIDPIDELSGKAFLTPFSTNGKSGIRICFANQRTTNEDIEILFTTLTEIAKKIDRKMES